MNKTQNLFKSIAKVLAPPPRLKVSDWADRYRRLSSESSAEPGQWNTSRAEYQRGIMDALNDPSTERVVLMTSAQVGKTEILLNAIGYYMDYDPSPIMVLQPTLDMAKTFSKDRLAPMLRDSPALKDKVGDPRSRDSDNTVLHKKFTGGHVTIVGANSPSSLASRPVRILLADEVDRYPPSAGEEGDPLSLAIKRTTTFWNRKMVFVSTPTIKGYSRIEQEYENSTREEWKVACPHCGEYQAFRWSQIRFDDGTMECPNCRSRFDEFVWKRQPGKWVAREENQGSRGFHLNELASPWRRWEEVIADFKKAKDSPELLKTWVNTSLGESWEEKSDTDASLVMKRREQYMAQVPDEVLLLTCGVDVQDDRLELEVVGWSHGKESWGIEYQVFIGDTSQEPVWKQLDRYLQKEFTYADGAGIHITSTCIDSGGHRTSEVYKFCRAREHRRIFAVKGRGGEGIPFIGKPSRNNRENAALFVLGVDQGKATIISRLKINFEGDGYCHFPMKKETGYNEDFFEGITSESMRIVTKKGVRKVTWVKRSGVRNEPLDCRNYATAAMEIFNPDFSYLEKNYKASLGMAQKPIPKRRKIISKGV
ncbi:phage terminase large subunit family protein [Peptoniphilus sp. EMRHCC_23]|uniref:phage terminase large subunit family protein n=1 Tax=Peptoniphilus rachelemmaiella TaxID=2811779 RepID=UPI001C0021C6|nr:phage terminase large subunit family protein [Peptoniphilus rachelemmaiella]